MGGEFSEESFSYGVDAIESMKDLTVVDQTTSNGTSQNTNSDDNKLVEAYGSDMQVSCFSEVVDEVTIHIQIIRLQKQIYVWIGSDSAKLGHLYAAAPTRPSNTVSVASLMGGTSDNTGSGIARRLVLKTGLPVVLACNIPKGNPVLEANAEKMLIQKLINLGYTKPKSQGSSS